MDTQTALGMAIDAMEIRCDQFRQSCSFDSAIAESSDEERENIALNYIEAINHLILHKKELKHEH